MTSGVARINNEIFHYYWGSGTSHGMTPDPEVTTEHQKLCLAVQRLDGFMSADADYTGGWLMTPLVVFTGNKLILNLDAKATGHAKASLCDSAGVPHNGFSVDDCDLIRGSHVNYTVTWKKKNDISSLLGQPIRLRIELRNCKLYAFQFID